ncbi:MAG: tRNA pseudouridine(38-40) synthase TruA [Acetobacteraceae bacterium]
MSTSWALLVEYDGAPFVGWQRQASGLSVQELIEAAAARLALSAPPATVVAGRTDAGVHAAGQVVQLTLDRPLAPRALRAALNFHLKPYPVAVLAAAPAPEGWSARHSARWRRYRYVILNRPARPALAAGRVWHVAEPLDAAAMAAGAALLLGRHDFTSFRASACQANSPLRTLDRLEVARARAEIVITAQARSFLHHQVRNMVGSLWRVGSGAWPPERMAAVLAARDRAAAGPTAPAEGLCLMAVGYPEDPFAGGGGFTEA